MKIEIEIDDIKVADGQATALLGSIAIAINEPTRERIAAKVAEINREAGDWASLKVVASSAEPEPEPKPADENEEEEEE